jgi:hypothetical protein
VSAVAFGPFEQFAVSLRISFITGVVVSSPLWLYQLRAFITPALHRNEKKNAAAFLGAALTLFGTGTVLAYFTISRGLQFLLTVGGDGIVTLPSIRSYLSFVTLTRLAFGIAFLFPVIVLFLNVVGIFPSRVMRSWRRGMTVGIARGGGPDAVARPLHLHGNVAAAVRAVRGLLVLARLRERALRRRRSLGPGRHHLEGLADDGTSVADDRSSPI